jgi:hypothetical protein
LVINRFTEPIDFEIDGNVVISNIPPCGYSVTSSRKYIASKFKVVIRKSNKEIIGDLTLERKYQKSNYVNDDLLVFDTEIFNVKHKVINHP